MSYEHFFQPKILAQKSKPSLNTDYLSIMCSCTLKYGTLYILQKYFLIVVITETHLVVAVVLFCVCCQSVSAIVVYDNQALFDIKSSHKTWIKHNMGDQTSTPTITVF